MKAEQHLLSEFIHIFVIGAQKKKYAHINYSLCACEQARIKTKYALKLKVSGQVFPTFKSIF